MVSFLVEKELGIKEFSCILGSTYIITKILFLGSFNFFGYSRGLFLSYFIHIKSYQYIQKNQSWIKFYFLWIMMPHIFLLLIIWINFMFHVRYPKNWDWRKQVMCIDCIYSITKYSKRSVLYVNIWFNLGGIKLQYLQDL